MKSAWEDTFCNWTKPSSDTEAQKQENAERMIREAIRQHPVLSKKHIDTFAQGSYRNNTNVRQDSDVDICVCNRDEFFYDMEDSCDYAVGEVGIVPAVYTYEQFKNDVQQALVSKFGTGVTRGDKAFDVHENSYRVDADVVAAWEYREYYGPTTSQYPGGPVYPVRNGTRFICDSGKVVTNYPEQHYDNGVSKNKATRMRFKPLVRILKRLRYYMEDKKVTQARDVPSYLIECATYNVPTDGFAAESYSANLQYVLAELFNNTRIDALCATWLEINGVKYLFHATQPWTRVQTNAFVSAAWDFVGFG